VLRTCAFGDAATGVWGAVWTLDAPAGALVALGDRSVGTAVSAALDGAGPAAGWALHGETLELVLSAASEAAEASNGVSGFDQLCRVSGRIELAGVERELSCLGYRAARDLGGPIDQCDSLRAVAAWFEPDEAIGLLAVRPRRAKGHESDALSAAVIEPDSASVVDDPRLSTTYADDGRPLRVALELWLADEQGEHRLRRAAGEAAGPHATGELGEMRARVDVFDWHSRGRDGLGVYLLAQRG
jgi:hypothetical protein